MKNIAVLGDVLYYWGGGIDFAGLLVGALDRSLYRPIVFLPDFNGFRLRTVYLNTISFLLNNRERVLTSPWDYYYKMAIDIRRKLEGRDDLLRIMRSIDPTIEVRYYKDDLDLREQMRRDNISVCFPSAQCLGAHHPIPWIGFIYDLQHKHLPEFFSESELMYRDREFRRMLRHARHVVVCSVAVKEDIDKFYESDGVQIHPVPFAAPGPKFDPSIDFGKAVDKYGLTKKYFVVMNQFWRHKNHMVTLKAVSELKEKGRLDFSLVFTGKTDDHRFPGYFQGLLDYIKANDLNEDVKILGFIPKPDQLDLMYHAQAVIQPTLFEGVPGGLSSVDAVSYGVPLILSDIPVNRYVRGTEIDLFDPTDEYELADRLVSRILKGSPRQPLSALRERATIDEVMLRDFTTGMIESCGKGFRPPRS